MVMVTYGLLIEENNVTMRNEWVQQVNEVAMLVQELRALHAPLPR